MPYLKEFIINQKTKIKLWEIKIGELNFSYIDNYDKNLLKFRKNHLKREQFLAVRKILKLENQNYKIRYNKEGKPSINSSINISISHSNHLAAVVFSKNSKVGLDIQLKKNKILKIQKKFVNDLDAISIKYQNNLDYLTMIWTAKESVYKALGIKGISLSNIIIQEISNNQGKGYYINGKEKDNFNLNFMSINDYIMCYAHKV